MMTRKQLPSRSASAPTIYHDEWEGFFAFLAKETARGDVIVLVYRVSALGASKGKYCGRCLATDNLLEEIQCEHGGGAYLLKFQDETTGRFRGQKLVLLAERRTRPPAQLGVMPPVAPRSPGEERMERLLYLLVEGLLARQ